MQWLRGRVDAECVGQVGDRMATDRDGEARLLDRPLGGGGDGRRGRVEARAERRKPVLFGVLGAEERPDPGTHWGPACAGPQAYITLRLRAVIDQTVTVACATFLTSLIVTVLPTLTVNRYVWSSLPLDL